jgi:SAM-dependent methyltransferase
VRLDENEIAVRCIKCGATPIAMSVASVLRARLPALNGATVYELSSRGALHRFLRRHAKALVSSQYVEGVVLGSEISGVRVEDVQQLTFPSNTFDVCTSTEVFEHVMDDRRGFRDVCRVLRQGGFLIFSVPIDLNAPTRERAKLVDGKVVHFETPEYHRDPYRTHEPVLAFRNYGFDIVAKLNEAGFSEAEIVHPMNPDWFGYLRPVVLARK